MAEKMTLEDHQFVAALTALTIDPWPKRDREKMLIEIAREVLPAISAQHRLIGPMVPLATALMGSKINTPEWHSHAFHLRTALRDLQMWRAGEARERVHAARGVAA